MSQKQLYINFTNLKFYQTFKTCLKLISLKNLSVRKNDTNPVEKRTSCYLTNDKIIMIPRILKGSTSSTDLNSTKTRNRSFAIQKSIVIMELNFTRKIILLELQGMMGMVKVGSDSTLFR